MTISCYCLFFFVFSTRGSMIIDFPLLSICAKMFCNRKIFTSATTTTTSAAATTATTTAATTTTATTTAATTKVPVYRFGGIWAKVPC
ncbi:unnamed protein product [Meloidogyne enterolobii]|uniref:Uncharacterized protein n=1 Tax=Meloidogyne enterolobii TaxID=390850 RepID=A0ACB1AKX5_MELEN